MIGKCLRERNAWLRPLCERAKRRTPLNVIVLTAKLSFLIANKTSIMYCVRLSIEASCKILRRRSKIAPKARGETSDSLRPTSLMKPTATSTESSVGFSNNSVKISSAIISWTTCRFTKCATKRQAFRQRSFWLRRNERRKTKTNLANYKL